MLCAPSSLQLHLLAEEGDCQSALVTTSHLFKMGREAIPQLDSQEEIDTTTTRTKYCSKSYLNSVKFSLIRSVKNKMVFTCKLFRTSIKI
jgi:hypothetical protein